ncbi:MAG: trigger factor [Myxococcota bacterium]
MAKSANEAQEVQVETAEVSSVVRELSVEVAAPRVRKAFDRAYKDLARGANVPGFRKGKVPRSVLERMYGSSISEEIERQLVAETLADAVELADVSPVSEPSIEADVPAAGEAFRYRARIEVKPEISLPDLEGLPATRPAVEVGEEEVVIELEQLRQRNAPLVEEPEGTPAAEGHTLKADFVGRVDGEPFEGGSGQDVEIEIGAGRMIPGFEEQLVGARAGDDVELEVSFPDDYHAENLRGKPAVFSVHVASVQRREVPELDDEFAKDVGEFETLEELRNRIREDITQGREEQAKAALHRSLFDTLIERTEFEVPPGLVERQLQQQASNLHRQFQGQLPDHILHAQIERMREEGRESAERRVRESLLLDAVSRAQGLEASDEEVDAKLGEMAEARGMDPDQLRSAARQQDFFDAIRGELIERKALDYLVSVAKVEETTAS